VRKKWWWFTVVGRWMKGGREGGREGRTGTDHEHGG